MMLQIDKYVAFKSNVCSKFECKNLFQKIFFFQNAIRLQRPGAQNFLLNEVAICSFWRKFWVDDMMQCSEIWPDLFLF